MQIQDNAGNQIDTEGVMPEEILDPRVYGLGRASASRLTAGGERDFGTGSRYTDVDDHRSDNWYCP
jgi:hypothetical protein